MTAGTYDHRIAADAMDDTANRVWLLVQKRFRQDTGATSVRAKPTPPSVRQGKMHIDYPSGGRIELILNYGDHGARASRLRWFVNKWPPGGPSPELPRLDKMEGRSAESIYAEMVAAAKQFAVNSGVVPEAQYAVPDVGNVLRTIAQLERKVDDVRHIDPRHTPLTGLQGHLKEAHELAESIAAALRALIP